MPVHENVETLTRTRIKNSNGNAPVTGASSGVKKMAEDVVEARQKIFTQKLAERGLKGGLFDEDQPRPAQEPAIKMSLDMGGILTTMLGTLADDKKTAQALAMQATSDKDATVARLLESQIDEMKQKLEEARSSNSVEAMVEQIRMVRDIERELGAAIGGAQPSNGIPAMVMLEIEKLKLESQDRQAKLEMEKLKWDAEREESRRKWESDQAQHHEEFLWMMKKFEVEREDKKADTKEQREFEERKLRMEAVKEGKRSETLNDLIGALSKGVDTAMASAEEGGGAANLRPKINTEAHGEELEEFECQECHTKAMISPSLKEYACPGCKTLYHVE